MRIGIVGLDIKIHFLKFCDSNCHWDYDVRTEMELSADLREELILVLTKNTSPIGKKGNNFLGVGGEG